MDVTIRDELQGITYLSGGSSRFRAPPSSRRPRLTHGRDLRPLRVLVVDDYEDTRRLYADALREAGIEVHEAHDGEAAVDVARQVELDIILMDMSMPGLDGWEATRAVRALPLAAQPYIIAITAAHGPESRRLAFEAGCDAFIAKPCPPDVVLSAVRAASGHDQGEGS